MKPLIDEPMYIEPRTYRNYEDYKVECGRARGWNQAMDYIFGERKRNESKREVAGIVRKIENGCLMIETKNSTDLWIEPQDIKTHRPMVKGEPDGNRQD